MRRAALLPLSALLALIAACGTREPTVTSSSTGGVGGAKTDLRDDPQIMRRAVDQFADRLVQRTSNLGEEIDRHLDDPFMRRKTLLWRLRAAQAAFDAEHTPNTLVALVGLWHRTSSTASYLTTSKAVADLKDMAPRAQSVANALRDEADALAARSLPPEVYTKLRNDIASSIGNGEVFAVDSVENAALLDQFLSATRLEKLLSLPLAPFEAFTGVSDSGKALGRMAITADRAIDLAEKYPQILQWRLGLVMLDVERLGTVQQVQKDLTRLTDLAEKLPVQLREQTVQLLNDSQPAQATAQKTLQDARAATESATELMRATEEAIARLDAFIAGFDKPVDPHAAPAPPKPPGEPFRITDYTVATQSATDLVREIRGALGDLQQAGIGAKAQAAADATIDHAFWRVVQALGVAFVLALALILIARRKRA